MSSPTPSATEMNPLVGSSPKSEEEVVYEGRKYACIDKDSVWCQSLTCGAIGGTIIGTLACSVASGSIKVGLVGGFTAGLAGGLLLGTITACITILENFSKAHH